MAENGELLGEYEKRKHLYDRFGIGVSESIKYLLQEKKISFLDIASRTKSWESFSEKIDRKEYKSPFSDMEDFCGVRVICYYPTDVDKICELIAKEFDVLTREDTAKRLSPNEFGYRSTHLIINMKSEWLHVPAHRAFGGLKAELQVRTVLMHAWAEIQHKLAYKSREEVPAQFQRRLFQLSAKFEEGDGQFEQLRNDLEQYRGEVRRQAGEAESSQEPLNLDILHDLLRRRFPDRRELKNLERTLLPQILECNFTYGDLKKALEVPESLIIEVEKRTGVRFASVGAMRIALSVTFDSYYEKFRVDAPFWNESVDLARKIKLEHT
jgi:ppGpp synthetase/RelA/SpoT-type nucleotidyltranferase